MNRQRLRRRPRKSLATQTSKATEEIEQQIKGIQGISQTTARAIRDIADVIGRVNEISTSISSAVEAAVRRHPRSRHQHQRRHSGGGRRQPIIDGGTRSLPGVDPGREIWNNASTSSCSLCGRCRSHRVGHGSKGYSSPAAR